MTGLLRLIHGSVYLVTLITAIYSIAGTPWYQIDTQYNIQGLDATVYNPGWVSNTYYIGKTRVHKVYTNPSDGTVLDTTVDVNYNNMAECQYSGVIDPFSATTLCDTCFQVDRLVITTAFTIIVSSLIGLVFCWIGLCRSQSVHEGVKRRNIRLLWNWLLSILSISATSSYMTCMTSIAPGQMVMPSPPTDGNYYYYQTNPVYQIKSGWEASIVCSVFWVLMTIMDTMIAVEIPKHPKEQNHGGYFWIRPNELIIIGR